MVPERCEIPEPISLGIALVQSQLLHPVILSLDLRELQATCE